MATSSSLQVIAPALWQQDWSESSVLGALTWLWLQSEAHQPYTLHTFGRHILPVLAHRQFALFTDQDQPVGYVSWAYFDVRAEQAYVQSNQVLLAHPEYWCCGDRLWLIDWFAPQGHTRQMRHIVAHQLFPTAVMRALYHKEDEHAGPKIMTFKGAGISHEEWAYWKAHQAASPHLV